MTPTPPQSPRADSVQPVQNSGESHEHATRLGQAPPSHGLPERTVAEIRQCLQGFPQIRWVKLYPPGLQRPRRLQHPGLREHIARAGRLFP